ncbi:MAG: hypothetical protein AB1397_05920 [bacterium]
MRRLPISLLFILFASFAFAGTKTTGIILTPTGNIKKQKAGFGGDLGFVYYIGDILRKEQDKTNNLYPIKSFYFFVDGKASPLGYPIGVAMGGTGFVVLQGSQPEGEYNMSGGGKIGTETQLFGFLYLVLSKEVMKNGTSIGILYGGIDKIFNPIIHNLDIKIQDESLAYFASLDTKIFKRKFGIEVIRPKGYNYFLVNTSIDKFLGFSLSYLKASPISSLIGYFGIRLNVF